MVLVYSALWREIGTSSVVEEPAGRPLGRLTLIFSCRRPSCTADDTSCTSHPNPDAVRASESRRITSSTSICAIRIDEFEKIAPRFYRASLATTRSYSGPKVGL